MNNRKLVTGRFFICCLLAFSFMITGFSAYTLSKAEARYYVEEGCTGCNGNWECADGGKCKDGCCPSDCQSYTKSCQWTGGEGN